MPDLPESVKAQNADQFRDAFSTTLIERLSKPEKPVKARKRPRPTGPDMASRGPDRKADEDVPRDAEELGEFIDYIATLTFDSLPIELQTVTHQLWADNASLREKYNMPLTSSDITEYILATLDPDIADTLSSYNIISPPGDDITTFLAPIVTAYLTAVTTPPAAAWTTRGKVTECEICGRDWVPLTYHHLIPRFVHAKAVKRGWHREEDLQNVAWLCRACHSFVHRSASHEELAREYFTVDRLLEREEIRNFAMWVGRVRWKAR